MDPLFTQFTAYDGNAPRDLSERHDEALYLDET